MHLFSRRPSAAALTTAATVVFILMLATGCGDTFRPVANPITQPGGDPAGVGDAIILAANFVAPASGSTGVPAPGTAAHINVSGDTVTALQNVQTDPRQATLIAGSVVVANFGIQNATPPVFGSVSAYPENAGPGASVVTVSVGDPNSALAVHAVFAHSTDNTNIYVAEQSEVAGPLQDAVGIIPLGFLNGDAVDCSNPPHPAPCHITDASISKPVAIAEPVGLGKVYVANAGSGKVTVIDVPTLTVKTTITVGSTPQAIIASADNNCLYVANQGSNNVTVINTSSDAATAAPIAVGGGPMFLRFDNKLQRVYVVNKAGNSISIINHAADCSASTATTVAVGPGPQSIAALADGSRAYVANSDGSVTVINTSSNTIKKTIAANPAVPGMGVGATPKIVSIGSSTDGAKVFVANNGDPNPANFPGSYVPGSITIIRTTDDTVIFQLTSASNPKLPGGAAASPQFVLMF
jgi:YVTN family beta-propeller protein